MAYNYTLALIAHNSKKDALAGFAFEHREALSHFHLVATEGTGTLIRRRTRLPVYLLEHGPSGGDIQLGRLAAENEVQAVIFFRDPAAAPYEPSFEDLLRVCDEQEIVLATNTSSAKALLYFLENSPERAIVAAGAWGMLRV